MDTITLATTALTLASPYLEKIGEGTARKIGEDIWNLIKKPFNRKQLDADTLSKETVEKELREILEEDTSFREELREFVTNAQIQIGTISQTIVNNGTV